MSRRELYQIYFDWSTEAKNRGLSEQVPEAVQLAQYVANPALDDNSNYPRLSAWAPVLRQIRALYEAGEIKEGSILSDEFFNPKHDFSAAPAAGSAKPTQPAQPAQPAPGGGQMPPMPSRPIPMPAPQATPQPQRTPQPQQPPQPPEPPRQPEPQQPEPEPAQPQPVPEPPVEAEVADHGASIGKEFVPEELASFDPFEVGDVSAEAFDPVVTGNEVTVEPTEGGLRVSWKIADKPGYAIARVLASDERRPRIADRDGLSILTSGDHFIDDDPMTSAARFYEVWVHTGETEREARNAPPRPLGQAYYIAPVEIRNVNFDGTDISAQWQNLPGTSRVAVYASTRQNRRVDYQENEVSRGSANLSGVKFSPLERGKTYYLAARRRVAIDGEEYNSALSPVIQEIEIEAELEAVEIRTSLTDADTVLVEWDPPASGDVLLYRTLRRAEPGIEKQSSLEFNQLERYGLPEDMIVNSTELEASTYRVNWLDKSYEMFITAVHRHGDAVRVGGSARFSKVGDIAAPKLLERVDEQVLCFGWPPEADVVEVYKGSIGGAHETEYPEGNPYRSVGFEKFRETGNVVLNLHTGAQLASPVSLALYPTRLHQGGERIIGTPAVVNYPGLETYRYTFELEPQTKLIALYILGPEEPPLMPPAFVLRHTRGRLPLERADGETVQVTNNLNEAVGAQVVHGVNIQPVFGDNRWSGPYFIPNSFWGRFNFGQDFLRLFLLEDAGAASPRRALLDPAPSKLSLMEFRAKPANPTPPPPPPRPEEPRRGLRWFGRGRNG